MGEENNTNVEQPKYTYEQLEEICRNFQMENKRLRAAIQEFNESRAIERLSFLFKIVENSLHFDEETVAKSVSDIKEAIFGPFDNGTETDKAE